MCCSKLFVSLPDCRQCPDPALHGRGTSTVAFQIAVTPNRNARKIFCIFELPIIVYYSSENSFFARIFCSFFLFFTLTKSPDH